MVVADLATNIGSAVALLEVDGFVIGNSFSRTDTFGAAVKIESGDALLLAEKFLLAVALVVITTKGDFLLLWIRCWSIDPN